MAITLAGDELSDADITDGIALGDVSSAARLWVRLWPTALNAARELVEPADVPAVAAEALIGTIAVIAVGRGPREDVKAFLRDAVRELRDVDASSPAPSAGAWSPDVSTSPIMSSAFAGLPDLVQDLLWITIVGDRADELIAEALEISTTAAGAVRVEALTTLQRDHLAAHTDRAEDLACRQAHDALAAAVEHPGTAGLSRETWMHLSACAWCTEAFHELVFSNAAIGALVDRAATARRAAPPTVGKVVGVADGGLVVEPPIIEPLPVEPLVALPAEPLARPGVHATDASTPGHRRRRRRVLAWAAAAVVAAFVALIVAGPWLDHSGPLGTAAAPRTTPTPDPASGLGGASPSPTPSSHAPAGRGNAVVGTGPSATHSPRAAKPQSSASSSPAPTPAPQPSPTAPTSAPVQTPTPDPTPTPTPTPTSEPCYPLAHLLGLC